MRPSLPTTALALLFAASSSHAQNLVPNGDFEAHGDCTNGPMDGGVDHWDAPLCVGGPSYFNACATPDFLSNDVPTNDYGTQPAHSGEGYIGCVTYVHPSGNPSRYAMVELDSTLTAGVEYCVRFMVSLGDIASFRTNTLHAYFTHAPLIACDARDTVWADFAQVSFDASPMTDTSWSLMEGSFVAFGNEQFLTLGNMFHGPAIFADTTFIAWNGPPYLCPIYIDDVFVGRCDVGIQEEKDTHLWVYPNPAADVLHIEIPQERAGAGAQLEILDALGRVQYSGWMNSAREMVDLSAISSGIYIVRVLAEGRTFTTQFSKE